MNAPIKSPATLGEVFSQLADTHPRKLALRTPAGEEVTFKGLNTRINSLNAALGAEGLREGDRVAILAKNSIAHVEVFGLTKSGVVVVPLNWRLSEDELLDLLRNCRPKLIFADDTFLHVALSLSNRNRAGMTVVGLGQPHPKARSYASLFETAHEQEPERAVDPESPVCILFTSGTSGMPKGVVHSHQSILNNLSVSSETVLGLEPDDAVMAAMPFFHVGGLFLHFFAAFFKGCTTTILPEYSADQVLEMIEEHKINNVHLVPTMIASVLDAMAARNADLSSLRTILYAASPMPTTLLVRALDTLPNCKFVQSYGATESGMITALSPDQHVTARKSGDTTILLSCGEPVTDRTVRIMSDTIECAAGEIGEIEIRSPGRMTRYWENHTATQTTIVNGWLRTGDLGYLDARGFLFIVDRKNDMIITGGENVFPTEVEEHLSREFAVAEASVFGVPDPRWVEKVVAAVVLKPGEAATEALLIANMKTALAAYKCPKEIHFVDNLPKNGAGKVMRKVLRDRFGGHTESR